MASSPTTPRITHAVVAVAVARPSIGIDPLPSSPIVRALSDAEAALLAQKRAGTHGSGGHTATPDKRCGSQAKERRRLNAGAPSARSVAVFDHAAARRRVASIAPPPILLNAAAGESSPSQATSPGSCSP